MVRIPGFQTRNRISQDVPRQEAPQANPVYQTLSGLGQEGAKIGLQLMAERKQAADLRDVDQKFLQFRTELTNVQSELTNAMDEDGTLNPEVFGFKDADAQVKHTYTEKLAEFFSERDISYAKTAASKESRAGFLSKFNSVKNESLLKAEAQVLEMESRKTLRLRDEVGTSITNGVLIQPSLEIPDLANAARDFWGGESQARSQGLMDEITYNTRNKAWSREMTIGSLDNFTRNQRPEDMLSLIFAGNMPKDFEKTLEASLMTQTQGGLAEIDRQYKDIVSEEELKRMKQRYTRAMSIDPEVMLQYRGDVDVEKLSNSLNRTDIEKYLREAMKVLNQRALGGERTIRAEHAALNRRMEEGRAVPIQEIREVTDKAAGVAGASNNFDVHFDNALTLSGTMLARRKGEVQRESLFMTEDEFSSYVTPLLENPKADIEAMIIETNNMVQEVADPIQRQGYDAAIGIYSEMLEGKYVQQFSEIREKHGSEMRTLRAKQREALKQDPGGVFDAHLRPGEAALYKPGQARISRMDEMFEAHGLPPHYRKYVSQSDIDSFKVAWDRSETSEQKVDMIENARNMWGGLDNWFKVANQYVTDAKLPPAMKIAAFLPNRLSMQSFISTSLPGREKLIQQEYADNNPGADVSADKQLFVEAVEEIDSMRDFIQGLAGINDSSIDALEATRPIKEAIGLYAMHIHNTKGGSFFGDNSYTAAMRAASEEIIGKNFHVVSDGNSSLFAPKVPMSGTPYPNDQQLSQFLKKFSDPKVVASLAKSPEFFNELAANFATMGVSKDELWERQVGDQFYWAVAPDLSGVQLRFRDQTQRQRSNDPLSPYSGVATDGKRAIILPWSRVIKEAGGR
jgi:hypothetical protein